jgi:uncharacterized protein YgiB involved in biofilm formation
MKRSHRVGLLMMGTAPILLTACGEPETPVTLYDNVDQCIAAKQITADECTTAFNNAVTEHKRVAPRYTAIAECEKDFGAGRCEPIDQRSAGIGPFIPFMAGYALGWYGNRPSYTVVQPLYHSTYGGYSNSSGTIIARNSGTTSVAKSAMDPPARAVTMSRAGFGSSASAKGSWGGGSRGSSGS